MSAGPLDLALTGMVVAPGAAVAVQAVLLWFGRARSERITALVVGAAFATATAAGLVLAVAMAARGSGPVRVSSGAWFGVHDHAWTWTLTADALSVPFALFAAVLLGVVGVLSGRYLHREPGFFRFHLLLALFGTGVELAVLAGEPAVLFFGWELVGLSSALLIAFFHERRGPVRNGLRAFLTYRACDAGLLAAVLWLGHAAAPGHEPGSGQAGGAGAGGDEAGPRSEDPGWSVLGSAAAMEHADALMLLLLLAVMGKSALVPVGGWLPRAMEGPTPSSALFYGAVSIHLGPYLLLRTGPLLGHAPVASALVVLIVLLTAVHGTVVGRAQTDVKSALAYGSMTQVGLIVAEIGLGLRELALVHLLGHATLRCGQILRSPSALRDDQRLEQALGRRPPSGSAHLERLTPVRWQPWLYRHALERGYPDMILRGLGTPVSAGLRALDRWQTAAADRIGGMPRPRSGGGPRAGNPAIGEPGSGGA